MGAEAEFVGKYRLVREVGRGATATVYLAEDPDRQEPVAVKVINFSGRGGDQAKWTRRLTKLFQNEAAVNRVMEHPNIIKTYDAVVEDDRAFLVMEYFEGTPLEPYCSFDRMLPIHQAVSIVFKCCMALDHAYHQGIIHRDIKPANILIDKDFNVKITDFGLALNIAKKSAHDSTFIMGVGSPAYMSPEQIKGYPLNQKTDLYSLGVVLFHLLTGRLPFRAKNPAQLVYKIINADPPSIRQLNPDIPEQMEPIIKRALEKDLYSRYRNGAEFAKDLSAVRYQILDDNYVPMDTTRYAILRKMGFFTEFEDVEIWETLRISGWREVGEGVLIMREGEQDRNFGLIIDGEIELSLEGRRVGTLGAGEVFGETVVLNRFSPKRLLTVVASTRLVYLEVNASALALASEECQEHFQERLTAIVVDRLGAASRRLAERAPQSTLAASVKQVAFELALVDDTTPRG